LKNSIKRYKNLAKKIFDLILLRRNGMSLGDLRRATERTHQGGEVMVEHLTTRVIVVVVV
jgi:hypothetical protein